MDESTIFNFFCGWGAVDGCTAVGSHSNLEVNDMEHVLAFQGLRSSSVGRHIPEHEAGADFIENVHVGYEI